MNAMSKPKCDCLNHCGDDERIAKGTVSACDRYTPKWNPTFQDRVEPWMLACFGAEISADVYERNCRFLEEALELVQSCSMTREDAHKLVDYTFDRPLGDAPQEVGGVMVTLAALCLAQQMDMHAEGEKELARIMVPEVMEKIRAKQAAKPKAGPLPSRLFDELNTAANWKEAYENMRDFAISKGLDVTTYGPVETKTKAEPLPEAKEKVRKLLTERIEKTAQAFVNKNLYNHPDGCCHKTVLKRCDDCPHKEDL